MEITTGQAIEINMHFAEAEVLDTSVESTFVAEPVDGAAVARAAEEAIEDARQKVAALYGPSEVVPQVMVLPTEKVAEVAAPKSRFQKLKEVVKEDLSLHLRGARASDIDQIVAMDMKKFDAVYKEGSLTSEELQTELAEKFSNRLDMLGSRWVRVLEKNGEVVGCLMACPTSKPPETFISWEDTTDNGTLKTTFDPDGKYLYVVTLASTLGEKGADMLMVNMIGKIVDGDYSCYFESRVPGLKSWVRMQCLKTQQDPDELNQDQLDAYAQTYLNLEKTVQGKQVPRDKLLRMYKSIGCSFVNIVPDAYQDPQSLNYGVVCQYENPLPDSVRHSPLLRKATGHTLSLLSHSNLVVQKTIKALS